MPDEEEAPRGELRWCQQARCMSTGKKQNHLVMSVVLILLLVFLSLLLYYELMIKKLKQKVFYSLFVCFVNGEVRFHSALGIILR